MAALWLSVVTTVAGAAGLGNLAVQSALGEPFRAEIDLLSYEEGSPQPRLGSPDLYRMVGFHYNAALSGAQLQQRKHPNGRNYVEVSTTRRIDEPFIHLLVELQSNDTRVIRGYTVLLNPYGYGMPAGVPAEFPPLVVTTAAPAALPVATRPTPAKPQAPAAPKAPPPAEPVAVPVQPAVDTQKLRQLEEQLSENAKSLAGMLERVAAMEQMVKQLRETLEKPVPAPPSPPPKLAAPPVAAAKPAPPPMAPPPPKKPALEPLPPRPERSWTEIILNEAPLILACFALLMVLGLGYWVWARSPGRAKTGKTA